MNVTDEMVARMIDRYAELAPDDAEFAGVSKDCAESRDFCRQLIEAALREQPAPEPASGEAEPATYGLRKRGTVEVIGVIPAKVHAIPVRSANFVRDYEEVPLYFAPPSTVPAAEVEGLVARWRNRKKDIGSPEASNEVDRCADELAALLTRESE